MPVKGLADPVQIYEVTGAVAARVQAAAGRGLTPFVSDVELDQLVAARQLAGLGRGQVVAIIGEAGVGKSRLVHEFLHSHSTTDWLVLETSSHSYGRATPYLPVAELLRGYFKIDVHDSTQSDSKENIGPGFSTRSCFAKDSLPPLQDLLDVLDDEHPFRSLDPILHRQHTYQAVTQLFLRESSVQPVTAVVEDLHWNDALSLGLLNELVAAAQSARLLLIVTYRPDYRDDWSASLIIASSGWILWQVGASRICFRLC